jgi:hypothetical protein
VKKRVKFFFVFSSEFMQIMLKCRKGEKGGGRKSVERGFAEDNSSKLLRCHLNQRYIKRDFRREQAYWRDLFQEYT